MRGLKHFDCTAQLPISRSHLLQMRGLKRDVRRWYYRRESVASFTDAWIETRQQNRRPHLQKVASFTDAWIETLFEQCAQQLYRVASFTDAWIETLTLIWYISPRLKSHLLQMRGLKP